MLSSSDYCGGGNYLNSMSTPWYPPPGSSYNFIMETTPSNNREVRNRAEKQRRDRLNAFISELATLVPMVARSAKRMDKTSILRLTATHLRIYQTLVNAKGRPHMELPKHVDQFLLEQLVCDQLGGFLLILTPTGKIVFVSHTVEHLLGHLQTDLMGQSLYNITSPEDHERLRTYLTCEGALESDWRKYFNIHIKRAGPRTEHPVYEHVRLMGMQRKIALGNDCNQNTSTSRDISSNSSCAEIMVFFVKIFRPEPLSEKLMEASKDEYVTRHLIDGKIVNCDQRISFIAGYMRDEVAGTSAFQYMHREDMRWVMIALRQMYDRGESRGWSCYRLKSRNGQFIFLRTVGFLEIDDKGIVESFVCINSLVTENEGLQLINEMKQRYSAVIGMSSPKTEVVVCSPVEVLTPPPSNSDMVEDLQEVEKAVTYLIRDLPSPSSDHRSTPSPRVNYNESQDCSSTTDSSPFKSYQVRIVKTAKRPPSTDLETNLNKRQKISSQRSPVRSLSPPVVPKTEPPIYQQLSNNV